MLFVPPGLTLDGDPELRRTLHNAADLLRGRLASLDTRSLNLSDYNTRYLEQYLAKLDAVLISKTLVLSRALAPFSNSLGEVHLVDYGGGTGLVGLLARAAGVGQVTYMDIYDVSCRDARLLARHLDLEADRYLHGELMDGIFHGDPTPSSRLALVAINVIEHIYDMERFLASLARLEAGSLHAVLSTTANAANPLVNRRHRKLHRVREYRGVEKRWGSKETDHPEAFLALRGSIIREAFPDLAEKDAALLAHKTRGLRREDILDAVAQWTRTGRISYSPDHPTNTCDPFNGNWAERLMNPFRLAHHARRKGFTARVRPGGYVCHGRPRARKLCGVANRLAQLAGPCGVLVSPTYSLQLTRKAEQETRRDNP